MMTRTTRRSLALSLLTAGLATGLTGCITLLPEVKPVQLYSIRFNPALLEKGDVKAPPASPDAKPVDVFVNFDGFPRASAGDRIVTTEGNEVSFVSGGRWASTAQGQFRDLMSEGFARQASPEVRLGDQGRLSGDYRLDVTVRRFEAAYAKRRPTVIVALDARLVRLKDRQVMAEKFIASEVAVRKGNLAPLIEGFETAASRVTVDLIGFTETAVAEAKARETVPAQ
ncbi:ABC-type transport auxiliary lipoprotein family protein [Asticcacaulis sp. DXS10W]|uniref:ABC-type transport auxiliary lipoprotein family protein n=1 Tax=Asticcacaulis currens TaxID=2984210 RepID=A0ABT5IJ04_9CAUL|nr:ABC-type transport auxiliary lipoprotein family protein [Asticcacaulis currens]MDC7696152.1 ABC-type transport auxiliary lipoprotein family protein [Asticcacaulis currens]